MTDMSSVRPRERSGWQSNYMALTRDLVCARKAAGLSQGRASIRIGVARRTFCRWEAGETVPDAMRLFQWADVVGITLRGEVVPNLAQVAKPKPVLETLPS